MSWNDPEDGEPVRFDITSSDENLTTTHRTPLVERSSLGYTEGMTTEVRIAPMWGNAVSEYIRFLRSRDLAPGTVYLRGLQLRQVSQAFRGRSPWDLQTEDLIGFMASLSNLSNGTKRSILAAIRGFYRYGLDMGRIRRNPAAGLGSIEKTEGRPRPADIDQVRESVGTCDDRTRLMIYLGVYAGLRASEISRVHTSDLVRKGSRYGLRVLGKGRKVRTVPMIPKLVALIQDAPEGWLFPSWHRGQVGSDGTRFDAHLTPHRVSELVSAALPPGVTCHMLRHRFASNAYIGNGHDLLGVSELLGHASVATTQTYTEIPNDSLWDAVDGGADLMG